MKNIIKFFGIIALVAVIGFSVTALSSCDLLFPQTAEITVTNASPFENDSTITVRVYMQGRGDPLATETCSKNQSVTFSLESGEYQIRVNGGGYSSFYYPQDSSFINMAGEIELRFNGNAVTRTN